MKRVHRVVRIHERTLKRLRKLAQNASPEEKSVPDMLDQIINAYEPVALGTLPHPPDGDVVPVVYVKDKA